MLWHVRLGQLLHVRTITICEHVIWWYLQPYPGEEGKLAGIVLSLLHV